MSSLYSHSASLSNRAVGSPCRVRATNSRTGSSPFHNVLPSPCSTPNGLASGANRVALPTTHGMVNRQTPHNKPVVKQPSGHQVEIHTRHNPVSNNNDGLLDELEHLKITPGTEDDNVADFHNMMLSSKDYYAKHGHLSDSFKERQECLLLAEILDPELDVFAALDVLRNADPKDALLFLKSNRGSRFVRDAMDANTEFCRQMSVFIVQSQMLVELSVGSSSNFIVQRIPNKSLEVDKMLCAILTKHMVELTMDKYGCRVVQAVVSALPSSMIGCLVSALKGFELKACMDSNGTHVIQCLLNHHTHHVYEGFFRSLTDVHALRKIMEDKFGCRIVQMCLDKTAKEITSKFVPKLLNDLIVPILSDAIRYIRNEHANYVIQNIMTNLAFKRQRDYIIDHVLLGNLIQLSQGKFSSHVVEKALSVACPVRLSCMFNEIFNNYQVDERGQTSLEIMLFDQYGNYVVQKILKIAIEVYRGKRPGDVLWIDFVGQVVVRNQRRLERYSSGKKIIQLLDQFSSRVSNGARQVYRQHL